MAPAPSILHVRPSPLVARRTHQRSGRGLEVEGGHGSHGSRLPAGTLTRIVLVVIVRFQLPMSGNWKRRPQHPFTPAPFVEPAVVVELEPGIRGHPHAPYRQ